VRTLEEWIERSNHLPINGVVTTTVTPFTLTPPAERLPNTCAPVSLIAHVQ
jgi:hypothetical protein